MNNSKVISKKPVERSAGQPILRSIEPPYQQRHSQLGNDLNLDSQLDTQAITAQVKEYGDQTEQPTQPFDLSEILFKAASLDQDRREAYFNQIADVEPELATTARRRFDGTATLPRPHLPVVVRLGGLLKQPEAHASFDSTDERYALGPCLGEGGMGRVFKAYDRHLSREVALKFPSSQNQRAHRYFLEEARTQAKVIHPNVLPVYDSGTYRGQPFIAMRYISGGNLAQTGLQLTTPQKLQLLIQVAEGLDAIHLAGLLHRDIKLSNILFYKTPTGSFEALISDFGLAIEIADSDDATLDEPLLGSPGYIAPERLAKSASPVDQRADIYSFGISMYRLLVGGISSAVTATAEMPHFCEGTTPGSTLPLGLMLIINGCLAKKPEHRFGGANRVAQAIRLYLENQCG